MPGVVAASPFEVNTRKPNGTESSLNSKVSREGILTFDNVSSTTFSTKPSVICKL